jgi:hypothetical protein
MSNQQLHSAIRNSLKTSISRNPGKFYLLKMQQLIVFAMLLSFGALSHLPVFAQGPHLEWAKQMGGDNWDNGYAIAIGSDRSVFTTGIFRGTADFNPHLVDTFMMTANGGTVGNTMFVTKLGSEGEFAWAKKFGNNKFNMVQAIARDRLDNVYVAGYFADTIDFDPGPGVYNLVSSGTATANDIFILKLTKNGEFAWAKSIGGTGIVDRAFSLTVDSSDNVLVCGSFIGTVDFDPGPGVYNLTPVNAAGKGFILKLGTDGNFVWAKELGQVNRPSSSVTAYAIAVDGINNIFATGYFRDTVDFDPGPGQSLLGSRSLTFDDIFIMKLDSDGNYVWAKSFGSNKLDQGLAITADHLGDVYFTAVYNDTVDFDPGPGTFNLIANYPPTYGLAVVKLSGSGNFLWAKNLTGPSNNTLEHHYAFSIKADKMGNTYTTGYFWGVLNINSTFLATSGASDMFLMKLRPNGDFVWAKKMGGPDIDVTRSSVLDDFGNVYTTGWFRGTSDFDPTAGTNFLTSINNSADIVIFKFGCGDTTSLTITDTSDCLGYVLNGTTYTTSGTFVQTVLNTLGCDSTITLNLTVIPVGSITLTVNGNTLGVVESYAGYQWLRNGQPIGGATSNTYTYIENGNYSVVVINNNGCSDTSEVHVVSHLSISDYSLADQIRIFPNPTADKINVQSPDPVNMIVIDIYGRKIRQVNNIKQHSIKDLSDGMYFLEIVDKKGQLIKTVKIIKR